MPKVSHLLILISRADAAASEMKNTYLANNDVDEWLIFIAKDIFKEIIVKQVELKLLTLIAYSMVCRLLKTFDSFHCHQRDVGLIFPSRHYESMFIFRG